jgi:hypothetical protein
MPNHCNVKCSHATEVSLFMNIISEHMDVFD